MGNIHRNGKDFPFLKLFDDLIISGNEKMIKPNKEIYNLAISRFNLIPKETVFIELKLIKKKKIITNFFIICLFFALLRKH